MKSKRKYYFISDINSATSIHENGIDADADGNIFIFTIGKGKIKDVLNIAGYIATNQMFLEEYALFEIFTEGITREIIDNHITRRTAQYQKIIKQEIIRKEHIKFVNCYKTSFSI